jgi:LysR family transcriptional regulator, hypochlorite-specific transcription factor HypT
MELKWLEDFLAVAGTGNFSRAAEGRNVTQPAFSRRLKALETWMGVPLLDRGSYPISLTPAGVKLLPVAERIVRDLRTLRGAVQSQSTPGRPVLKFAMPHSLAVDFFPAWWLKVSGASGNASTKVVADNLHDCVELLMQGGCQFLLCYRSDAVANPMMSNGFSGIALARDALVAVSAGDASGAPLFQLDENSKTPIPFLNYAPDAFLGKVTAGLLNASSQSFNLSLSYESALAEAVRAQTLARQGVAWLPRRLIEADLQLGRLVPAGANLPEALLTIWLYRSTPTDTDSVEQVWHAARSLADAEMT